MDSGDRFDRYEVLRPLGRGGMGEVYRAQDTRLKRNVALKILKVDPSEAGDTRARTDSVDRLFREARAAAALEHPNVVVIHDVGEIVPAGATEPVCFIAMEYIQGTVLRELVGSLEIPIAERMRWLTDAARALGFAHSRGIVHRDMKPDNVMLREDGVIKVLDFGIARRANDSSPASTAAGILPTITGKGFLMGTPRYMSPEQMLNESLDGRSDQYAWGLMAYELLSGESPWAGTVDSVQLIAEMFAREPDSLRSRAPDVPEDIARVIDRTLSRNKKDRFASMEDVLAALGVAAPPPSSVKHVPPGERRLLPEVPTLAAQQSTRPEPVAPRRLPRWTWLALGGTLATAAVGGLAFRATRARTLPVAPATVRPGSCVTNAECATRLGEAAVCGAATRTCAKLASEDCRVSAAAGDVANETTIWVGAMFPLTGDDAKGYGTREFRAVDLARADFAQMLAGANARPRGGRPLALVVCDDAVDPQRALRHLVDEVGVPAVIGFRSSNEAIEAATSTLIPRQVMGLAALNTSPMISSLPAAPGGPRLVWRTTFSAAEMALPIARMVPELLEPAARARPGAMKKGEPLRVALLRQDDAAGLGFADVLFRTLEFNGRSALQNESSYRELVYRDGADAAKLDELAADLVAFAPHVVIDFGGDDPFVAVVERAELAWKNEAFRPTYIKAGALVPAVVSFIGASTERRHRFLGVTSESTTAANARFVSRYNAAYADHVTRTFSPNSSYDAFYVVGYASLALGDAPVTGLALSRAVSRLLPPGKPIDVGPSAIFDGLNELASGRNIDLNGATGPLDFDLATGDATVDLAVICADVDAHGVAANVRESGLVYEATSHDLRGTMHCP